MDDDVVTIAADNFIEILADFCHQAVENGVNPLHIVGALELQKLAILDALVDSARDDVH